MSMEELIHKYYKVVVAQIGAYGLSYVLISHVFLGPLPVMSPDFKQNVAQSPEKVATVIKELPGKLVEFASAVQERIPHKETPRTDQAALPSPWVFVVHTPTPTPYGTPGPTAYPDPKPTKTPSDDGGFPRIPLPTLFQPTKPDPTSPPQQNPTAVPTTKPKPTATPVPTKPVSLAQKERETLDEINKKRRAHGASPVIAHSALTKAARDHAAWMSAGGGLSRCGHAGSGGSNPQQRAQKAGYKGFGVGEIVACAHPTAKAAVAGWMSSPPHKAILIDRNMKEVGIGWGNNMAVAVFGS